MKKKKVVSSLIILTSVLVLGACGSKEKDATSGSKKEETVTEQVVSFGIPQEVASLDPATATDKVSFGLLNQIYEGFYRMDKDNQPIPAGAKELAEKSEDGLTYTLTLRDDAKWSNGEPVTAADYVYAWQRVADPETGSEYAYLLEPVKNAAGIIKGDKEVSELGIEAVSDTEVKITLEVATPYFESLLAFPTFFPLNQKSVEEFGKDFASSSEKAIYNGPFVLSDFDGVGSDLQWSYLKNDEYWDADKVKLTKVDAQVVKEASTALNLFEDGQLDDVIITGELAQQYRNDDNYVTESDGRTIYVDVNKESKTQPFDNVNFRKALSYAIDGEAIVNNVLGDGSTVSTGIVPRELASNPVTKKDFVEDSGDYKQFDEAKAKEYFEKAKKELNVETVSFDIMTDDNDSTKKIAEYMQGAYKEVLGIKTTVTPVTKPIRLDRTSAGDYDMVLTGWGADYNDPGSFLDLFVTGNPYNRGRYANPAYDELIKEASIKNGNDLEARWQNYLDAEKLLLETDAGIIPVYQVVEGHLRNPKMKGYVSHTAGASYDYKDIYVEE